MLCVEDFVVNISVERVVEFYANVESAVMRKLRAQYDGVCYMGHLILHVDKVIRIGECQFVSPTNATIGTLAVQFRATVVNCAPGDVLSVTVGSVIDMARISAKSQYVSALFINSDTATTTRGDSSAGSDVDMQQQQQHQQQLQSSLALDMTAALQRDVVAFVTVIDCGANPGYTSIPARVELRPPTSGAGARCYPILRGSVARAFECPEMTIAKYVANAAPAVEGGDTEGRPVQDVARTIRDRVAAAVQSRDSDRARHAIDMIARYLLQKGEETAHGDIDTFINIVEARATPAGATHFVVFDSINPLDARVGIAMGERMLRAEWRRSDIPQDCGVILARLLERFIMIATAYENMVSELANRDKLKASATISRALTS